MKYLNIHPFHVLVYKATLLSVETHELYLFPHNQIEFSLFFLKTFDCVFVVIFKVIAILSNRIKSESHLSENLHSSSTNETDLYYMIYIQIYINMCYLNS